MKKITEEQQMRIFDLLEGNLSEKEKATLVNEIAANEAMQHEYGLLAKTYLNKADDAITFPNKAVLYKNTGLLVAWNPMKRYAAAAAAILLFGFGGWYFSKQNPTLGTNLAKSTENAAPVEANESNTEAKEGIKAQQGLESLQSVKFGSVETGSSNGDAQLRDTSRKTQAVQRPENFQNETEPAPTIQVANITSNIVLPNDTVIVYQTDNGPVSHTKKRSLSYKLFNNSKAMLANLQLPQVQFKTEPKANRAIPKVKMQIRTYNTDVIATLID